MDYLYSKLDDIRKGLDGKFIFLFLDFDGTISPIARTPDAARLSGKTKKIIKALSLRPMLKIAIISGRSLKNLKKKVALKKIIYVGNHGLEIKGPKIKFNYGLDHGYKVAIGDIGRTLRKKLYGFKGVLIENKTLCLSLHYRKAVKKNLQKIKAIFYDVTRPYVTSKKIEIKSGKKLLEARPPVDWHKGSAVKWLLERDRYLSGKKDIIPIYIGDDLTDEDAFKTLRKSGITIFVGKDKKSAAKYYLNGTRDVIKFLGTLLAA